MNCEKQICTICRLLVEVRANAADSQADLMLLANPPQSPAISIQPFTPLSFWQCPKFIPRTEVFWIQQSHLVFFFPAKGANTPLPLPDPNPKAAFEWSQQLVFRQESGCRREREGRLASIFIHNPKGGFALRVWVAAVPEEPAPAKPQRTCRALQGSAGF